MSHYDVHYGGLGPAEKKAKALADVREWLGERFDPMVEELRRTEAPPPRQWVLLAGFAGVQGYPVGPWYEHIWGREWTEPAKPTFVRGA